MNATKDGVVRIECGSHVGTGFVFADGRVLTALHVIADRERQPIAAYGNIALVFHREHEGRWIPKSLPGILGSWDVDDDWAVVEFAVDQLDWPVPQLELSPEGSVPANAKWSTYGFPESVNEVDGGAAGGHVQTLRGSYKSRVVIELFSKQAAAGDGEPIQGYSGAPAFVDGRLVGILCAGPRNQERATYEPVRSERGTLYATPIWRLVTPHGPLPVPTARRVWPPPPGWELVTFASQRGLEAALRGDSLGARDVVACPVSAEVAELRGLLDEQHYAGLVGVSGVGKSLTLFQTAHAVHHCGASVYRLVEPSMIATLPEVEPGARRLLVVDEAHNLTRWQVSALSDKASDRNQVLLAGNDSIPGLYRPVVVDATRAVRVLDVWMRQHPTQIRQLVQEIDTNVGEGSFDTPIERVLDEAAKSKNPWQYMFVLGRGHLRTRASLDSLGRADEADLVLLLISLGQLASYNVGIPLRALEKFAEEYGREPHWVAKALDAIRDRRLLIVDRERLSTPHPRLATSVIARALDTHGLKPAVQNHLREILVDETLPLRGRAWLIDELHFSSTIQHGWAALTPEVRTLIHDQVVSEPDDDDAAASAAWMLHSLVRSDAHSRKLLRDTSSWLVDRIHAAGPASGYALHNVVNDICNSDKEWARQFIAGVDARLMAAKLLEADEEQLGAIVSLIDRLLECGNQQWRDSLFVYLDYEALAERWEQWSGERIYSLVDFAKFLIHDEREGAHRLLRSIYPSIRRAFERNVLEAWQQLWQLVSIWLGLGPLFDEPSEHQLEIAKELSELVEPEAVSRALSESRQRDWHRLAELVNWLRRTAPAKCKQIEALVDTSSLIEQARPLAGTMPHDLEQMLGMLYFGDDDSLLLSSVLHELKDEISQLRIAFAALVPSVGAHILSNGGRLNWELKGGQPGWRDALAVLSHLEQHHPEHLVLFVEQAVEELADGLLLRQSNSVEGVEDFLSMLARVAPRLLERVVAQIDPEAAGRHWSARQAGGVAEQRAVLEVLRRVGDLPGPAQLVAQELTLRPSRMACEA